MTQRDPKSIAEEIEFLARLTEAPAAFVEQVRALFMSKAISLDEDATPYRAALEEAFRREEAIRTHARQIRKDLASIEDRLGKLGEGCRDRVAQLRRARDSMQESVKRLREKGQQGGEVVYVLYPSRRVFRESDFPTLVPGPKDTQ